ncbi:hypothetical protein [Streptococcus minor]|uniref:hypothetical protein n=1 Tax=Streptococcus minor TaxID=229549 RepID=UPI00037AACB6|nr:hypothetical protein [Streptococcus minor]
MKAGTNMYELCLEYGTFPISLDSNDALDLQAVPDFLLGDTELVAKLTEMNDLFHSLFIEIEGSLDYVGRETPEKVQTLHKLFDEVATVVKDKYEQVRIEPFYLE